MFRNDTLRGVVAVLMAATTLSASNPVEESTPTAIPAAVSFDVHPSTETGLAAEPDTRWTPWISKESGLPYRLANPDVIFVVDPAVVDAFGIDVIATGLTAFNDTEGSTFRVMVTDGETGSHRAGTFRMVVSDCTENSFRGSAHPIVDETLSDEASLIVGGTIRMCERFIDEDPSSETTVLLVAHELGHLMGLGHMCSEHEECHDDAHMKRSSRCSFMFPQRTSCQEVGEDERQLAALLYPQDTATAAAARADAEAYKLDDAPTPVVDQAPSQPTPQRGPDPVAASLFN